MSRRVPLGRLVITPGAQEELHPADVHSAIARHAAGDWGDVCIEDFNANDVALRSGLRLLSSFKDRAGIRFWIITEADRSVTTILLPDEY